MRRIALTPALAIALGCSGAAPKPAATPPADDAAKSAAGDPDSSGNTDKTDKTGGEKDPGKKTDPLFPTREVGWKAAKPETHKAARDFAGEYLAFLGRAQTPRRAVSALVDAARAEGAVVVDRDAPIAAGGFYASVEPGGSAASFFRPGTRPITDGLRVVVVSVDAPRLLLKQVPVAEAHGFAMLQTHLHGGLDLASWMVYPLGLYLYVDRGGRRPTDVVIGGKPGEPVLSIPDVLPHLSDGVQRRGRPVSDPERLDALGARTQKALLGALAAHGVSEADLSAAEAYLIPATRPVYIGADRGLIGGYGQRHRALAYAAVRALARATPERAAVVIAVDNADGSGDGPVGSDYVSRALAGVVSRLAPEADVFDIERAVSRSSAIVAIPSDKGRNKGVRLNIRSADSLPRVVAAATRALDEAGVQYQVASARESTPSRDLGTLNIDAIDMSIAVTGAGTPGEVVSVLDLYQGVLACRAWLSL